MTDHSSGNTRYAPNTTYLVNKSSADLTRSMINESTSSQYPTNGRTPRLSEFLPLDLMEDTIQQGKPMILTSRKNRKYSEAGFNQELLQNMNRSQVFDSKILSPLKFGDKDKTRSPKIKQQINKTVSGASLFDSRIQFTKTHRSIFNRTNVASNSVIMDKPSFNSPRLNFETTNPPKNLQRSEKKSVSSFIDVYAEEINHNSQEKTQIPLKSDNSVSKSPITTKKSLVFRRHYDDLFTTHSETTTPVTLTPPEEGILTKHTFSTSNMQNFFKKVSVDDRMQNFSPTNKIKQTQTNDGSNVQLTPTQSLRSSINRMSREDFYFGKRLGKGKFGEVFLVKHKESGFLCGMKIIPKKVIISDKLQSQLISQIKVQLYLSHPNIVAMYGVFSDKENIYLLLEPCLEGQLYQKLKKMKRVPEQQASYIVKEICTAVEYLHSHKIMHRDIKPENILLSQGVIKICDFGWAVFHNDQFRQTFCGTPLYLSPEQYTLNNYDDKVDNWAIGILTYQLLIGRIPFKITTKEELEKIVKEEIVFPEHIEISEAAKHFIMLMLERNPSKRGQLQHCVNHPFFESE